MTTPVMPPGTYLPESNQRWYSRVEMEAPMRFPHTIALTICNDCGVAYVFPGVAPDDCPHCELAGQVAENWSRRWES